jgi:hypothetical protein
LLPISHEIPVIFVYLKACVATATKVGIAKGSVGRVEKIHTHPTLAGDVPSFKSDEELRTLLVMSVVG